VKVGQRLVQRLQPFLCERLLDMAEVQHPQVPVTAARPQRQEQRVEGLHAPGGEAGQGAVDVQQCPAELSGAEACLVQDGVQSREGQVHQGDLFAAGQAGGRDGLRVRHAGYWVCGVQGCASWRRCAHDLVAKRLPQTSTATVRCSGMAQRPACMALHGHEDRQIRGDCDCAD
jgi:hypothetical protein